ncbi:c-type cytochrome [Tamlana fucoidanivorans]|uniref:C-type cytochrome n=1 Tax=Allotamlana fucoidanivorans TaxID=2583814 RepID=A0A5C4SNB7_9FLAO|nr:c-type cytochrome [Tamlana fucoidanivorans]TNJ45669.1 c-type cytochrome [Tamlana fucoidanivorans]
MLLTTLVFSCKPKSFNEPQISLDNYQIEEGFELSVAASEPFIEAPVSMDFDNKGRMWVVEMKGFMRNLQGTGDDIPNGTISILEDLDHDGITDHSKVFIDSLILPRALAHVYGGLLYAEPPNLWFVDIKDDQPINKVLVDSLYSDGGNVEHQPNGLMVHIDNWIYNAKSNFRYQRKHGEWIKEPTSFRGQWGITKDNFGRLYVNTNSTQIMGDFVLPNTINKNVFYKPEAALNKTLTTNQRVYPLHATSVNRGYVEGVLDEDSLLINVTSACGPMIYRGDAFPENYLENAFVCAPEANIVKRNILSFENIVLSATQAIPEQEFIASTDEGFRPVNLFNGPDGNMYVVDMHRGIIQDKAFMTPYLQEQTAVKKLDTIIGMGRILKVTHKNNQQVSPIQNLDKLKSTELVDLLKRKNGWFRDRAQQLLVYRQDRTDEVVSALIELLQDTNNDITQIHALHTLNGLNVLDFELLESFVYSSKNILSLCHAIVLLEQFASVDRVASVIKLFQELESKDDAFIDLYILSSLGNWVSLAEEKLFPLGHNLSKKYKDEPIFQEAFINSLRDHEEAYASYMSTNKEPLSSVVFQNILETTLSNKKQNKKNFIYTKKGVSTDSRTEGYAVYRNFCATCHGLNGEGVENLAPPLMNSDYVSNSPEKLALVVLHGLRGPIHVNDKLYEFNMVMPGLANNPEFSDEDIQNIILYVTNAFSGNGAILDKEKIMQLRKQKPEKDGGYSEEELIQLQIN